MTLTPVRNQPLVPEIITDMVAEVCAYYDRKMAERRTQQERRPAEVEAIGRRIARLQDRLKSGDPHLTVEELQAIMGKAEATRVERLAARHRSILDAG
jgi:hypothetical protein